VVVGWAAEGGALIDKTRTRLQAEFTECAAAADAALASDAQSVSAYSARGDARLFLGEFRGAVADFEKMIALDPAQDAPHWRLGIAYYFAGDFAKSARQFEKYHTYDRARPRADARRSGFTSRPASVMSDSLWQADRAPGNVFVNPMA
jgi:tetratricopeptide (TPR) repeat protein